MRKIYDLISEPRGEVYRKFIEYSMRCCDVVLLVGGDLKWLRPPGKEVLNSLEQFLKEKVEASEWPGSKLAFGRTAPVFRFRLCPESAKIFKEAVEGLYGWSWPYLPRDFCLLRPDGTPWLVTISSEDDGYFELTNEERDDLLQAIPELKSMIRAAAEREK